MATFLGNVACYHTMVLRNGIKQGIRDKKSTFFWLLVYLSAKKIYKK